METDAISLTVFFQAPFWIGVFERVEDGRLSACKVTFSAEEKALLPGEPGAAIPFGIAAPIVFEQPCRYKGL